MFLCIQLPLPKTSHPLRQIYLYISAFPPDSFTLFPQISQQNSQILSRKTNQAPQGTATHKPTGGTVLWSKTNRGDGSLVQNQPQRPRGRFSGPKPTWWTVLSDQRNKPGDGSLVQNQPGDGSLVANQPGDGSKRPMVEGIPSVQDRNVPQLARKAG